MLLIR
jgi:hypothetical protein